MKAEFEYNESHGANVLSIDGPSVQYGSKPLLYLSVTAHGVKASGAKGSSKTLIGIDKQGLQMLRAVIDTALSEEIGYAEEKEPKKWDGSKSPATSTRKTSKKASTMTKAPRALPRKRTPN